MAIPIEVPADPFVTAPPLPCARGSLSEFVLSQLTRAPSEFVSLPVIDDDVDALGDDDFQLALYCCYELHYRGFAEVDPEWEWAPSLLGFRRSMERQFEAALRDTVPVVRRGSVTDDIRALIATGGGPSLSAYLETEGSLDEMREMAIHRSAYQLKEADPHTWAIPRLTGAAKAAMVEIQADEYGGGDPTRMHASLFADTMVALGLDPTYGAYLDRLPGTTLATTNLISLFGLHRQWRGALVGHLAVFEMTSVGPMGRYSRGLQRLGIGPEGRRFYDAHVEADAIHQYIACDGMVAGLMASEPELAADVLFGAGAVMALEERFSLSLLGAWAAGRSSLLPG